MQEGLGKIEIIVVKYVHIVHGMHYIGRGPSPTSKDYLFYHQLTYLLP